LCRRVGSVWVSLERPSVVVGALAARLLRDWLLLPRGRLRGSCDLPLRSPRLGRGVVPASLGCGYGGAPARGPGFVCGVGDFGPCCLPPSCSETLLPRA
ncbi:unnamed protein product, partial [Ascophyllum nodosum]